MTDICPVVQFLYKPDMYTIVAEKEGLKGDISSPTTYEVPYKTVVTHKDNIVYIDLPDGTQYTFVATAAAPDNQYDYFFMNWTEADNEVAGQGAWTDTWVVTAHFAPEPRGYYVDWVTEGEKGTVITEPGYYVPYGTVVTYSGDTVTITEPEGAVNTFQAIPAAPDGEKVYKFVNWTHSQAVAGQGEWNMDNTTWTCVAHFDNDPEKYKVTVLVEPDYWGTVNSQPVELYLGEFDYGTPIDIVGDKLTVGNAVVNAKPAAPSEGYTYYFVDMKVTTGNANAVLMDTVITAYFDRDFTVNFKVASDSTGMGTVSIPDSFIVPAGTTVQVNGDTVVLGGSDVSKNTATPAAETAQYVFTFVKWTGADDNSTPVPTVITEPTTIWAHFTKTAIPYSVVIKYMCDGAPILKDGADIRVNSQGEWGQPYTYNYLDNPKFDETMAAKYSLLKGYIEQPSNPTNQGETITTTINSELTVFVFEFSKKGAYVQFHRNLNPVANPVYETPEPYGDTHYATLQAMNEPDAGKKIQVLITDPTDETSVSGTFIGAGQSATYNGYTYSVNQLPKVTKDGKTYDAVEIVISGGLNVHDDINDPLVIWYQLV